MRPRLLLTINWKFAVDFFARGLHTRTAVARLSLRQLGFLVYQTFANVFLFFPRFYVFNVFLFLSERFFLWSQQTFAVHWKSKGLRRRMILCVLQVQDAVSRFSKTVKFSDEDIWIGARRQTLPEWTWVKHIILTGWLFEVHKNSHPSMNNDGISSDANWARRYKANRQVKALKPRPRFWTPRSSPKNWPRS